MQLFVQIHREQARVVRQFGGVQGEHGMTVRNDPFRDLDVIGELPAREIEAAKQA